MAKTKFAKENVNFSVVAKLSVLKGALEQKVQKTFPTYQPDLYHFENFGINQTQMPSPQSLPCSELVQIKKLFKGAGSQGHVTVNKPVISIIYIVAHTWPLCSAQILVDGVNPLESYFQKSTNISAIVQHMSVFLYEAKESIFKITPSF